MSKKRKIRVAFQKNRGNRTRQNDLTRETDSEGQTARSVDRVERLTGKGDLSRHRTVIVTEGDDGQLIRDIDPADCLRGRVLSAIGLNSIVLDTTGIEYECSVRRVVRTLARDARNAVVTGDEVLIRATGSLADSGIPQAVIERVEPRRAVLSRAADRHEHIIAANVDQAAIVASLIDPPIKPSLIDRFLVACEKSDLRPLICMNKVDAVPSGEAEGLRRMYERLGYQVIVSSALAGTGIEELRRALAGKTTVFSGQSGVGKSSLLNAAEPDLQLQTGGVSGWTGKGTHTTRRASLLPLPGGGFVVDTPGIRQFSLWDVSPDEVEAWLPEFPRFVAQCRFPGCTHTHEEGCAVKRATDLGLIHKSRYASYLKLRADDAD